jgi:hypothetical protein
MLEFPRAAIQTVVEILLAGQYRERAGELAEAVMAIVVYATKSMFGDRSGPLAVQVDVPALTDEQALAELQRISQSADPREGEPQAALDPAIWQPLVTWLLQMLLSKVFKPV